MRGPRVCRVVWMAPKGALLVVCEFLFAFLNLEGVESKQRDACRAG